MQSSKVSVVLIYKLLEACKYIKTYMVDPAIFLRKNSNVSHNKLLAMMAHMLHYLFRILSNYYMKKKQTFYKNGHVSSQRKFKLKLD